MNKQISNAMGWVIGVLVVFPCILYGINYFFKNKFNDGKLAIPKYASSCYEYRLLIPRSLELKTSSYATSFLAPKESIYNLTFREPSMDKFFVIKFFNFPMDKRLAFRAVMRDKIALLTVNKDDLNSPNYGTKENPIPVFKVRENLPDSVSIKRGEENGWNADITDKQFKYNVEQYLTYVMSKKEFQKRFGKN